MRLGQQLHGKLQGVHGTSPEGGFVRRPRLYELTTAISFGGRRRRLYDTLVASSGTKVGDRVLDVGCGPGFPSRRAARAVGPAGRVDGIDPSREVITYANRFARDNIDFHVATAEELPFPDETFDVTLSSLALHHIPASGRRAALQEMHRVLKPRGTLLIAEFRPANSDLLRKLIDVLGGPAMRHNLLEELPGLITDTGFRVSGQGDHQHWVHHITATKP